MKTVLYTNKLEPVAILETSQVLLNSFMNGGIIDLIIPNRLRDTDLLPGNPDYVFKYNRIRVSLIHNTTLEAAIAVIVDSVAGDLVKNAFAVVKDNDAVTAEYYGGFKRSEYIEDSENLVKNITAIFLTMSPA